MATTVQSTTRAFACPLKYIQGPGEFDRLESYTNVFGSHVLFLIDGFLYEDLKARLGKAYASTSSTFTALKFGGECCAEEFQRLATQARSGCDVLVGIGGGKTMDTAKIVANELDLPLIIVPSSASTDAPTSAMSVVYTKDGVYVKNVRHKRHASLVLLDTEIIAKAAFLWRAWAMPWPHISSPWPMKGRTLPTSSAKATAVPKLAWLFPSLATKS